MRLTYPLLALLLSAAGSASAVAQPSPPPQGRPAAAQPLEEPDPRTIIVTGRRLRGEVHYPTRPVREIGADAVAAYGADTLGELVEALEPETRVNGGSASDPPIVLLNGSRIGSLAEVSGLPSEAIERVEILPEDLATAYGYPASRRVLNIILRPRYESVTAQSEAAGASEGGRAILGGEAGFVRIRSGTRVNLDGSIRQADALTRGQRGLVSGPGDLAGLLSLVPATRQMAANGALALPPWNRVAGTLSFGLTRTESYSRVGLVDFTAPPLPNPDFWANRRASSMGYRAGLTASGDRGTWRWSALGAFERTEEEVGDRSLSAAALTRFGSAFLSRFATQILRGELQGSGPVMPLPAGDLFAAFNIGLLSEAIESRSGIEGQYSASGRRRGSVTADLNLHVPIAGSQSNPGIGELSAGFGLTWRHFSDFGSLTTLRGHARWSPTPPLTLSVSFTRDEGAPGVRQLGEPILTTPNVPTFDLRTGQVADVTYVTGGNPALQRNARTEGKIEAVARPFSRADLLLSASYTETRLTNPISIFPALSADVEAAFPARFVRGAGGELLQLDLRPITVAESRFRGARWGASYAGPFGSGDGAGRFTLSAYHSVRFENGVILSEGGPVLDLLDGGALGTQSGLPRHSLELQGNLFRAPWGFQFDARWQSGSVIRSAPVVENEEDLFFAPRWLVGARAHVNLEGLLSEGSLAPLRNARLSIAVDNLLDEGPDVRTRLGQLPFSYQRRFLEPVGRLIRLSLRVLF